MNDFTYIVSEDFSPENGGKAFQFLNLTALEMPLNLTILRNIDICF